MSAFRVGIAGLSRGVSFVRVLETHPEIEVAALCDLNREKLEKVGKAAKLRDNMLFENFDDFVNADLDIVVIATPIALHTEQSIKALESGKHVLCEQTVAYTVEDCERVVNAVKKTGRKYMMAENYTYFHFIREWQKILAQGRLGEIYYAEAEYIHGIVNLLENPETGEFYWRADRPPIWYCAHCLGPILTLMNDRVARVAGLHSGFHGFPERRDKIGFLDMEVALFQTVKGKAIKILRSQTAHRHMVAYCLYGTKGTVECGRGKNPDEGYLYIADEMKELKNAEQMDCPRSEPNASEAMKAGGHGTCEYYMIRDFLLAIENDTNPPIDVIRSTDFTIPGIIAHESAMAGGEWLDVPRLDW